MVGNVHASYFHRSLEQRHSHSSQELIMIRVLLLLNSFKFLQHYLVLRLRSGMLKFVLHVSFPFGLRFFALYLLPRDSLFLCVVASLPESEGCYWLLKSCRPAGEGLRVCSVLFGFDLSLRQVLRPWIWEMRPFPWPCTSPVIKQSLMVWFSGSLAPPSRWSCCFPRP